jgi:putative ATP-dependent endonuclease of the OLD family
VRLKRVRVENHGRLQDVAIEVREHLVLVGPNDVGKSSLIRCLDLLLGASIAQLYARLSVADFRDSGQPLVLEAALGDFSEQEKALFADEITVDPLTGDLSLVIRLEATVDQDETLDVRRTGPDGGTGRQLSRDQLSGLGWKMIGAIASARDLREDRSSAVDDILRAVDLGDEKAEFVTLAKKLQTMLTGSAALGGLRGRLAGQLTRALPEKVTMDDLLFVPGATATDDVLNDVRLQVTRHGKTRNLTEQSDGMRALFAIALYDLVSESANIVAIDEPEIHLHPTSQRSLARLLQTGRNQKIIATHSADIVGAFPPDNVVTVKLGGVLVQPQQGFLAGQERMQAHWWVRDRLEPLTARRVIGVEGVSDRIILQKVASLTGRDLDRLGVSVTETDGAGDMGAILALFGNDGFRIPLSLLIDSDAVSETARRLNVPQADLAARSVWVSDPDLEGEYVAALGADIVWQGLQGCGMYTAIDLHLCAATGPRGTRTDGDVAAFCRRKGCGFKVRAAMVVAGLLTPETARKIKSVSALLDEIAPAQ